MENQRVKAEFSPLRPNFVTTSPMVKGYEKYEDTYNFGASAGAQY